MIQHRPSFTRLLAILLVAGCAAWSGVAAAQTPPNSADRADPGLAREQRGDNDLAPARSEAPAVAAPEIRGAETGGAAVTAGAIRVEGAVALSPADFAPAIEPYLGRPLDPADLRALTRDIADAARRRGFGLATAWIPQQSLIAGILTVHIEEGRIDAVEVEGPHRAAVERRLAPLVTGRPVRTAELERHLLLAGDLAGASLGRARLLRRDGRNILFVSSAFDRVRGRASLDNGGTGSLGPVRATLGFDLGGLLIGGDRLSFGGVLTPAQPREYQYAEVAYSVPVGRNGTEVTLRGGIGHSAAGGRLRPEKLRGNSAEAGADVTHPILRSRDASLWASIGFTLRDSHLERAGVPERDDRVVSAYASLFANARAGEGRVRVRLSYVRGLDVLGATRHGAPLASRDDAGGVFSKAEFWIQHDRPLGRGFSLDARAFGQFASRPLLASEEMGLGGRQFLRAFDYWEVAGDRGAAAVVELRYDLRDSLPNPLRRAQFYLYADAGRVTNLRGGLGGGTLASAGGGVRVWLRNGFDAGVEIGVPLTDSPFNASPGPRLSFRISKQF